MESLSRCLFASTDYKYPLQNLLQVYSEYCTVLYREAAYSTY